MSRDPTQTNQQAGGADDGEARNSLANPEAQTSPASECVQRREGMRAIGQETTEEEHQLLEGPFSSDQHRDQHPVTRGDHDCCQLHGWRQRPGDGAWERHASKAGHPKQGPGDHERGNAVELIQGPRDHQKSCGRVRQV